MKKIFKKGELTTQQIVVITILMASFAVILFFLFRLNIGQQTNAEICHNSVILKGKSSLLNLGGGSLNCKTNYVCISGGGGCGGGITETINIDTSKDDQTVKNQTMKAIADKMANCWWMFGEGKVDYVGKNPLSKFNCAVCSNVVFDDSFNGKEIHYSELADFMAKNKHGDSTYLKYLYGVSDVSSLKSAGDSLKKTIKLNERNLVVTGLSSEGVIWNIVAPTFSSDKEGELKDRTFQVGLIKPSEVNTLGCDNFLTKA